MSQLVININQFEGPLDLLLHLVKEQKLDILDLDLQVIIQQFLDFIFENENIQFDQISDYLPVAAYLIELQTKKLLPVTVDEMIDSEYETEINRQNLIKRILEYKKFKEITAFFAEQSEKRKKVYSKPMSDFKQFESAISPDSMFVKNEFQQLQTAMLNLWKQLQTDNQLPINLKLNAISAEDRAAEIKKILKTNPEKIFQLTEFFLTKTMTLHYFVITFIAILDLANHQSLIITQSHQYGPITLQYRKGK